MSSGVRVTSKISRFSTIRSRWDDFGMTPMPWHQVLQGNLCGRLAVFLADSL